MYYDYYCFSMIIIIDFIYLFYYCYIFVIITEHWPKPVLIHDLHQSHPDLRWWIPIKAVDGGVLAVCRESGKRYNVVKIDQDGKIINKLYVTDKLVTALIWEDPDLYVILGYGGDIIHVRDGNVIKQHKIKTVRGWLYGGDVDKDGIILIVDTGSGLPDGTVISYNVQTGQEDIKLKGLQRPTSITKTVHNNQVLYLITEELGHCASVYDSSWIKQTTIGSG